jgi:hypothetical protein
MDVGLSSIQLWLSQYRKEQKGITPKPRALTPDQIPIQALENKLTVTTVITTFRYTQKNPVAA